MSGGREGWLARDEEAREHCDLCICLERHPANVTWDEEVPPQ